jgi:hypothetical protein
MKAAAFWFGSNIKIETFPIEADYGLSLSIRIPQSGEVANIIEVSRVDKRIPHGTIIEISELKNPLPDRGITRQKIETYLPSIYRSFTGSRIKETNPSSPDYGLESHIQLPNYDLPNGIIPITLKVSNGTSERSPLAYTEPELWRGAHWDTINGPATPEILPNPDLIEKDLWRKSFIIKILGDGTSPPKIITGWIGLLKRLSRETTGFYLHYRGKGISGIDTIAAIDESEESENSASSRSSMSSAAVGYRPSRIFGQQGSTRYNGITGSIDMSVFGKSITTDQLQWTPDEEAEFIEKLYNEMNQAPASFVKMASNLRRLKNKAQKRDEDKEIETTKKAINSQISKGETGTYSVNDVKAMVDKVGFSPDLVEKGMTEKGNTTIQSFKTRDGKIYKFHILFISDPDSKTFINVIPKPDELGVLSDYEVQINDSHKGFIAATSNSGYNGILLRLALACAMMEVFTPELDSGSFRIALGLMLAELGQ